MYRGKVRERCALSYPFLPALVTCTGQPRETVSQWIKNPDSIPDLSLRLQVRHVSMLHRGYNLDILCSSLSVHCQ